MFCLGGSVASHILSINNTYSTRFFTPLFRSPHLEHPIFRWAADGMNSKKVSSETGAVKKNCALTQREALKFVRL